MFVFGYTLTYLKILEGKQKSEGSFKIFLLYGLKYTVEYHELPQPHYFATAAHFDKLPKIIVFPPSFFPQMNTAKSLRASSAQCAGAPPPCAKNWLEIVLFHKGEFSHAFYMSLAAYLEWAGPLLSSSKPFSLLSGGDDKIHYPSMVYASHFPLYYTPYHDMSSRSACHKKYERVTHLYVQSDVGRRKKYPKIVTPTDVITPWFPSVTSLYLSEFCRCPGDPVAFVPQHFPKLSHIEFNPGWMSDTSSKFFENLGKVNTLTSVTLVSDTDDGSIEHWVKHSQPNTLKRIVFAEGRDFYFGDVFPLIKHHAESLEYVDISNTDIWRFMDQILSEFSKVKFPAVKYLGMGGIITGRDTLPDEDEDEIENLELERQSARALRVILEAFPSLEELDFSHNYKAGEKCFETLCEFPLKKLNLSNSIRVKDGFFHFPDSPLSQSLQEVDLSECRLMSDPLQDFFGIGSHEFPPLCIRKINLDDNRGLRTGILCAMAKCLPNLEDVSIKWSNQVNGLFLEALGLHCKRMKHLSCERVLRIKNHHVKSFVKHCPCLETLMFSHTSMTDASLIAIAKHCPNLQEILIVNHNDQYTDEGIVAIASQCVNLRKLRLSCTHGQRMGGNIIFNKCGACDSLTDACLRAVEKLPKLKDLSIIGGSKLFTPEALRHMVETCSSLESLHMDLNTTRACCGCVYPEQFPEMCTWKPEKLTINDNPFVTGNLSFFQKKNLKMHAACKKRTLHYKTLQQKISNTPPKRRFIQRDLRDLLRAQ